MSDLDFNWFFEVSSKPGISYEKMYQLFKQRLHDELIEEAIELLKERQSDR